MALSLRIERRAIDTSKKRKIVGEEDFQRKADELSSKQSQASTGEMKLDAKKDKDFGARRIKKTVIPECVSRGIVLSTTAKEKSLLSSLICYNIYS
jgi:hypothetical protein